MIGRLNLVLAVALVLVVVLASLARVDYSQPNVEVLPDMKYTPAWTTFAKNPNFANGRTLQAPVFGTIARGEMPLYYAATTEDAVRAGEELENPYDLSNVEQSAPPSTETEQTAENETNTVAAEGTEQMDPVAEAQSRLRESVVRGGDVYRVFCITCHGPTGKGDGQVTQRGFPPPPSLLTGKSLAMKDGQLFHILTYGQGNMSDLAGQLRTDERWDVINYVRNIQPDAPATAPLEDAAPAGDSDGVSVEGL